MECIRQQTCSGALRITEMGVNQIERKCFPDVMDERQQARILACNVERSTLGWKEPARVEDFDWPIMARELTQAGSKEASVRIGVIHQGNGGDDFGLHPGSYVLEPGTDE